MLTKKRHWIIAFTLLTTLVACHSRYRHMPTPLNIQKNRINCLKNSNTTRNAIQFLEFRRNQQPQTGINKKMIVVDQALLDHPSCPQLRATITALMNVAHSKHITVIIQKKPCITSSKADILLHLAAQVPTHETIPTFVLAFPS